MDSKVLASQITTEIVKALIQEQFPQWQNLHIHQVLPGGWDNRTFRLGEEMLVRLPSNEDYAAQVTKEQYWLPKLQSYLNIAIPRPIARGEACELYPLPWSVYGWINGETVAQINGLDKSALAKQLAHFLKSLHTIDTIPNSPMPGEHNFYRGSDLLIYHDQVIQGINLLQDKINTEKAKQIWQSALKTHWQHRPVWVHGDISVGNLLVADNQLSAVIDFGCMAVGDPACDLAIAWTFFDQPSRQSFKTALNFDEQTWARGAAWALWKALIVCADLIPAPETESKQSWFVLNNILETF